MTKIDTQTKKQILLNKMEDDRLRLAQALTHVSRSQAAKGSSSTTARTAGALAGWPAFLRKPLRALAGMSWKEQISDLLFRKTLDHHDAQAIDPDISRLIQLTNDLKFSINRCATPEEIARIQLELDNHIQRLRKLKQHHCDTPPEPT